MPDHERHVAFPPIRGHLAIATSSRQAALAGLAMYTPCRPWTIFAHRIAWLVVSALGPAALPGRRTPWTPPMDDEMWRSLRERWERELGPLEALSIYRRRPVGRRGFNLLALRNGEPRGLIKVRPEDDTRLANEYRALDCVRRYGPTSFAAPAPLALGEHAGWHYLTLTSFPARLHRPPRYPPLGLVLREVDAALEALPRSVDVPPHWRPMHGDFTPWNLRRLDDGRLVLFDWEDAGWGPPGADETLYRATEAALGRAASDGWPHREAAAYWEERLRGRPEVGARSERKVARVLKNVLHAVRATSHPSATSLEGPRPRVLVFAYAGEPGRGSEPGAGWGLIRAVSEFADCVALIAPEHVSAVRVWQAAHPTEGLSFIEVPEPPIARYAKWHRIPWFLIYLAWLREAAVVARRLHRERPFQAIHHATYSTYWLPTPAVRLGAPAIWGPVGGAVTTPVRLWPLLGWRGILDELLDLFAVRIASWWPATRDTWRRAALGIVQNEETLGRLPVAARGRARVLNHALFVEVPARPARPAGSYILYTGGLESRKAPVLAIRALAHAEPSVRLVMVGDGPERRRVQRLAARLGVRDRVELLGQLPRARVLEHLAEATAAVFTGLREEGGVALAEAMMLGTPVIVLAHGGARTVASSATDPRRAILVEPGHIEDTARRLGTAMTRFHRDPPAGRSALIDQEVARRRLRAAFEEALAVAPRAGRPAPSWRNDPSPGPPAEEKRRPALRHVHYYPLARRDSGVAIALWAWARALAARGEEVVVLHAGDWGPPPPQPSFAELSGAGIADLEVPHRGRPHRLTVHPVDLEQYLTPGDVLVLHEGWVPSNHVAARAARRAGIPYLVVPHGVYDPLWMQYLRPPLSVRTRLERRLLEGALAVHLFHESEIPEILSIAPGARCVVAPTGYDIPAEQWTGGGGYVSWVGRVDVLHKGLDVITAAIAMLPASQRPRLVVHGYDYKGGMKRLRRVVAHLGVEDCVSIHGAIAGEAKRTFLRRAEGYVHPSRWECHSTALLENLALGVPCLVSSSIHIAAKLDREGAALLSAPNAETMAEKLVELLQRREELSARGRSFVREHFAWERVIPDYLDALRGCGVP